MRKLNLSCGCVCERQAAAAQRGAQQQGKKKGKKKGKKPKKDGLDMEEILAVQVTPRRLPVPCSWPDNRHDGESVDWVAGRAQETIAKLSAGEKPTAPGEVNVREANIWPESVKPPEAIRTRPSTGKASLQHGNPNRKAAAASSTSSAGWGASDVPQLDAPRSTVERIAAAHNVSTEHLEAAAEAAAIAVRNGETRQPGEGGKTVGGDVDPRDVAACAIAKGLHPDCVNGVTVTKEQWESLDAAGKQRLTETAIAEAMRLDELAVEIKDMGTMKLMHKCEDMNIDEQELTDAMELRDNRGAMRELILKWGRKYPKSIDNVPKDRTHIERARAQRRAYERELLLEGRTLNLTVGTTVSVQRRYKLLATATVREGPDAASKKLGEHSKGAVVDVVEESINTAGLQVLRTITRLKGQAQGPAHVVGGWLKVKTSKGRVLAEKLPPSAPSFPSRKGRTKGGGASAKKTVKDAEQDEDPQPEEEEETKAAVADEKVIIDIAMAEAECGPLTADQRATLEKMQEIHRQAEARKLKEEKQPEPEGSGRSQRVFGFAEAAAAVRAHHRLFSRAVSDSNAARFRRRRRRWRRQRRSGSKALPTGRSDRPLDRSALPRATSRRTTDQSQACCGVSVQQIRSLLHTLGITRLTQSSSELARP